MKTANVNTKLRHGDRGHDPAGALRCPECGRAALSVDIDCRRWRYCNADRLRWCIGDNRNMPAGSTSAEHWHVVVDRVIGYRIVECVEVGSACGGGDAPSAPEVPPVCADVKTGTLLTREIRQRLPKLYATEDDKDPVVQVRFFSPWSNWVWWATEFDGKDVFFGLVEGFETEWGYFSLSELESTRGPGGVPAVERDRCFSPAPVSQVSRSLE